MPAQLNLVETISRYVTLQPGRKALKGKCPFHRDEMSSLMVIPNRDIFKCFGCGAEGGTIEFLMLLENKTRTQVVEDLGQRTFSAQ
jgi:DNA primase